MNRTGARRFSRKIVLDHNERAGWQDGDDPFRSRTYFVSGQPECLADGQALSPGKVASRL
jgi:hypothetical protein